MVVEEHSLEDAQQPETVVHALLLPFPALTHLVPLVQLAKKLAASAKLHQCGCKFVFTTIVSYHIASEAGAWVSGADDGETDFSLRTIAVPDGISSSSSRGQMSTMIQACLNMKPPTLRFVSDLVHSSPRLSVVIGDVFVPWAADLANSFDLRLFSVYTPSASSGCVLMHAPSLVSQKIIPFQDSKQEEFVECPGAPPLLPRDFPPSMLVQDVSHPRLQYALNLFSCLQSTGGLILNTCFRLEANAVTEFQARCPTYTVGPLFLPLGGVKDQKSSNWKENEGSRASDCLAWLDTQAASSVIYVSFGTLAEFSHEQIRELAWGLEMSHQPFLWVIHKSFLSGMFSDVLPQGFSERVKDRCFLTPWAPQLEVLTHRSIGGFFTHCGWNSILENITLSGVPMLCWPDKAEQGMNARLIVDVWKLGIPFKVSKECDISRDEVQAAVKNLMLGEGVQEMRRIGGELKQVVQEAVKEGGSSLVGLKDLVLNMKNKNSE